METVLLTIHIILVSAMVLVIVFQRSSSDGLSGLGGGVAGANSIFSARGSANFLTRTTAILATAFICSSLALAYLASNKDNQSIADKITQEQQQNTKPSNTPSAPQVPLVK